MTTPHWIIYILTFILGIIVRISWVLLKREYLFHVDRDYDQLGRSGFVKDFMIDIIDDPNYTDYKEKCKVLETYTDIVAAGEVRVQLSAATNAKSTRTEHSFIIAIPSLMYLLSIAAYVSPNTTSGLIALGCGIAGILVTWLFTRNYPKKIEYFDPKHYDRKVGYNNSSAEKAQELERYKKWLLKRRWDIDSRTEGAIAQISNSITITTAMMLAFYFISAIIFIFT